MSKISQKWRKKQTSKTQHHVGPGATIINSTQHSGRHSLAVATKTTPSHTTNKARMGQSLKPHRHSSAYKRRLQQAYPPSIFTLPISPPQTITGPKMPGIIHESKGVESLGKVVLQLAVSVGKPNSEHNLASEQISFNPMA